MDNDKKTTNNDKKDNSLEANSQTNANQPSEGKTIDEIKQDVILKNNVFGATSVEDINKNVGEFTSTIKNFTNDESVLLDEEDKQKIEKQKDKQKNNEINFDKFIKSEQNLNTKNKFFQKFGVFLRSKKGFRIITLFEAIVCFLVFVLGSVLAGVFSPLLHFNGQGPLNSHTAVSCLWASSIMIYLCMCIYIIPVIYILSAYFVGINQIWISRGFHLFLIINSIVILVIFITALFTGLIPYIDHLLFMSK